MFTRLEKDFVFDGFELKNVSEYDSETLVRSEVPEEIIMAVLGNFAGKKPVEMIRKVLSRLQEVSSDQVKLQKYVYQLTVLSRLRNLQEETIKEAENMPLTIDINKDVLYKRGIEKGIKEEKINSERKVHDIALQLKKKGLEEEEISRITGLSVADIRKL